MSLNCPKHAGGEPFLGGAKHDLLALVYAFVVVLLVLRNVILRKSHTFQEHNPIRSGMISVSSVSPGARNMVHIALICTDLSLAFGPKSTANRISEAKPRSKVKLRAWVVGKFHRLQNTARQDRSAGNHSSTPRLLGFIGSHGPGYT